MGMVVSRRKHTRLKQHFNPVRPDLHPVNESVETARPAPETNLVFDKQDREDTYFATEVDREFVERLMFLYYQEMGDQRRIQLSGFKAVGEYLDYLDSEEDVIRSIYLASYVRGEEQEPVGAARLCLVRTLPGSHAMPLEVGEKPALWIDVMYTVRAHRRKRLGAFPALARAAHSIARSSGCEYVFGKVLHSELRQRLMGYGLMRCPVIYGRVDRITPPLMPTEFEG